MGIDLWQCTLLMTLLCCPTGKPGHQHHDLISHSVTLSWHWANQSLCYLIMLNTWIGSDKYHFYKSLFCLNHGFEPTISYTWNQCSTDSATAPSTLKESPNDVLFHPWLVMIQDDWMSWASASIFRFQTLVNSNQWLKKLKLVASEPSAWHYWNRARLIGSVSR